MFLFCVIQASAIITKPETDPIMFESFTDESYHENWKVSALANVTGFWDLLEVPRPVGVPREKMIVMGTNTSHYGISTQFKTPLRVSNKPLIIQYETRFLNGLECGGAYIKLFGRENFDMERLCNDTKYVVMFGPDRCFDMDKVHFIFRHKNPVDGFTEEKHMQNAPTTKYDLHTHLYTLIIRPDNSFEVFIDTRSVRSGNMLTDFEPPFLQPREIDDPDDVRPDDWEDSPVMDDPEAVMPIDWNEEEPEFIVDPDRAEPPSDWLEDEPLEIPDVSVKKPKHWLDEDYGEWEPPMIPNPRCRRISGCGEYDPPMIPNEKHFGRWIAPQIPNPRYKGEWKVRRIPNPRYFEDNEPHKLEEIAGVGFELWAVTSGIGFGNVYIGDDESALRAWNEAHFKKKRHAQKLDQKKLEQEEIDRQNREKAAALKNKTAGFFADSFFNRVEFRRALRGFGADLKEAWTDLYNNNKMATLVITLFTFIVPSAIIFTCCCGEDPASQRHARRRQKTINSRIARATEEKLEKMRMEHLATHKA